MAMVDNVQSVLEIAVNMPKDMVVFLEESLINMIKNLEQEGKPTAADKGREILRCVDSIASLRFSDWANYSLYQKSQPQSCHNELIFS